MFKYYGRSPGVLCLVALLVSACGSSGSIPQPTATSAPTAAPTVLADQAIVESIDIRILESFPVQVNAVVRGQLPDACSLIDKAQPTREGNTFRIALSIARRPDARCAPALTPFEHTLALEVAGLTAGTYLVTAGGVSSSFTLNVDNILQETPPAGFAPASIEGQVWSDGCAIQGGEGSAPAVPGPGCVPADGGGYRANGGLDAGEPGIGGVQVTLGEGVCPSSGLAVTTTDANGAYSFLDLNAGTYCVSVDALSDRNKSILLPGGWTAPAPELGSVALTLQAGESRADVNFGWDHQFLPASGGSAGHGDGPCLHKATFVADVTIPDNTVIAPGASFVKTWRVRNDGTCTWGPNGYLLHALAFFNGDRLGGPDEVPLPREVPPGSLVDVSVNLTAPGDPGTYRSEWMFLLAQGPLLGVGRDWQRPLYAQILVGGSPAAVLDTNVKYVMALVDVNVHIGPGAGYSVIQTFAAGQTALVTGVSADGQWWRVLCPDDRIGSCWVSANLQSTQPTSIAPGTPIAPRTLETSVRQVMALMDVTIYSGPGAAYAVVGQVFGGQMTRVYGVSADGQWWRVFCPDDTLGNCWVAADPALTQPATAP